MSNTPQKSPAQARLGQGGLQVGGGGPSAQPMQRVAADTRTMDLLMKVGEAVIRPHVERAQQAAYLEGATRIAQGESLKEIVDEQPWYSQIFGPAASSQGARQAASIKQVDSFTNRLFERMSDLRQLTPDDASKEVHAELVKHLTGDPQTDMVIQQKMLESSGQFFRAHAKEHVAYVQGEMQSQVTGMVIEATKALQHMGRQRAAGMISEEDWQLAQVNAAGAMMPLEGQTAESFWAGITVAAEDAMVQGNFHVIGLMEESGLIAQMPPEMRKTLLDNVRKYENITRERDGYWEFGPRMAQLAAMADTGQISPAQIGEAINAMNVEFSAATGINTPLFSRGEMEGMLTRNYKELYRLREAARKESSEAAKEARDQAMIAQYAGAARGNIPKTLGYDGDQVDMAIATVAQNMMNERDDNKWAEYLADNYTQGDGHVNPHIQRRITDAMRKAKGSELHPGTPMDTAYGLWLSMNQVENGIGARNAYFGEDDVRMINYHEQLQMGADANVAYQIAFGRQKRPRPQADNKEVVSGINDALKRATGSGWWGRLFGGGWKQSEDASKELAFRVNQTTGDLIANTSTPTDTAYDIGTEQVMQTTDTVGPWSYKMAEGQGRIYEMLGESKERVDKEVVAFVTDKLVDLGYSPYVPGRVLGRIRDGRQAPLTPTTAWRQFPGTPAGIAEGAGGASWGLFSTDTVKHVEIVPTRTQTDDEGNPYHVYTLKVYLDGAEEYLRMDIREIEGRIRKDKSYKPHIKE